MSLYSSNICPAVNCSGQLVVEFDDHANPTAVYIRCKSCGYVVSALSGAWGSPVEPFTIPLATVVAY